jgi:AcrR family transcriptional regulator
MNRKNTDPLDTKEKVLDAAEYLFARDGYRGTSLRAITGKAGVNLAAVNYHFGSKKILVEEVIKRRIVPLNNIRKKRLEEIRKASVQKKKKPDIRAVLAAFIEPTLFFKESNPEAEHFFTFIGRSMSDPDDTVRNVFIRYIKPLFELMFETVCKALPGHPPEVLFWRLHYTIGALFHTMHVCGHMNHEFKNMKTDTDAQSLIDMIIPFVTAGMKAR